MNVKNWVKLSRVYILIKINPASICLRYLNIVLIWSTVMFLEDIFLDQLLVLQAQSYGEHKVVM